MASAAGRASDRRKIRLSESQMPLRIITGQRRDSSADFHVQMKRFIKERFSLPLQCEVMCMLLRCAAFKNHTT